MMVTMGRTRCRLAVVVTAVRAGCRLAVVVLVVRAGCRFAVVPVVGGRVSLRTGVSVVVWGCLCNGGQQGCHSYEDEFFHD